MRVCLEEIWQSINSIMVTVSSDDGNGDGAFSMKRHLRRIDVCHIVRLCNASGMLSSVTNCYLNLSLSRDLLQVSLVTELDYRRRAINWNLRADRTMGLRVSPQF